MVGDVNLNKLVSYISILFLVVMFVNLCLICQRLETEKVACLPLIVVKT